MCAHDLQRGHGAECVGQSMAQCQIVRFDRGDARAAEIRDGRAESDDAGQAADAGGRGVRAASALELDWIHAIREGRNTDQHLMETMTRFLRDNLQAPHALEVDGGGDEAARRVLREGVEGEKAHE